MTQTDTKSSQIQGDSLEMLSADAAENWINGTMLVINSDLSCTVRTFPLRGPAYCTDITEGWVLV